MTFYKECLGGELSLQTVGESPMSYKMPSEIQNAILHSILTKGELVLMGSDMVADAGLSKGNSVSLMLNCESEKEVRDCYEKLAKGGERTHPLEVTFWGALFGDLTDQFGNHWLLHYQMNKN
jgi:PhnB protein